MGPARWKVITPSEFPWEQEAFDFIRSGLPDADPYLAWQGFNFISDNGSIYEVDALILTPVGFFLVEVKSTGFQPVLVRHPGRSTAKMAVPRASPTALVNMLPG